MKPVFFRKQKNALLYVSMCFFLVSTSTAQERIDTSVKEIVIVFKTHFDIGYTNYAEAVTQRYSTSMMEGALDIIRKNKSLPADKRFVWTLSSWPMTQILNKCDPSLKPQIEDAIKSGYFSIHSLPITQETESSDLECLVRGLSLSSKIARTYQLPLPTDAKMTDVPSHSWVLPTLLTHAGIKFLHIGCNPASSSPKVPLLFWWQGPDGSKLMTMYWSKDYGTTLIPPEEWKLKTWLAIIHTNDNHGPPSPKDVEDVISRAKKIAPNANIKIGRLSDFYDAVIKESPSLETIRGDMPDTWIHGFMSMPREVKTAGALRQNMYVLEALNTEYQMWTGHSQDVSEIIADASVNSFLFNEHTFGLSGSSESFGDDFKVLKARGAFQKQEHSWREKADRIYPSQRAVDIAFENQMNQLSASVKGVGRKVMVYNPLPWMRTGVVNMQRAGHDITSLKDAETGEITEVTNEQGFITFIAKGVPSMGYRTYHVIEKTQKVENKTCVFDAARQFIENDYLKVFFDSAKGCITSMIDKQTGKEMVNQSSSYGFGQYLYEQFGKENVDQFLNTYPKIKPDWAISDFGKIGLPTSSYKAFGGNHARIVFSKTVTGVSATMFFAPTAGIPHDYNITYTLYTNTPYLEILWGINGKPAMAWPEAGWISLPFNLENTQYKLGRLGGIVNPAQDFIEGSNFDFNYLNTGMALIDHTGSGYGLSSPGAPCVSLDRPGLWTYTGHFDRKKPNVFVNLYNNQWSTNFTEWVDGSWSTKLYVWSVAGYTNESSVLTPSMELRVPLQAAPSWGGKNGTLPFSATGIGLSRKGILITAFGKNIDGDGTILRLWEQAGDPGKCVITLPGNNSFKSAQICDLRGQTTGKVFPVINGKIEVDIGAYAPVSLLLK